MVILHFMCPIYLKDLLCSLLHPWPDLIPKPPERVKFENGIQSLHCLWVMKFGHQHVRNGLWHFHSTQQEHGSCTERTSDHLVSLIMCLFGREKLQMFYTNPHQKKPIISSRNEISSLQDLAKIVLLHETKHVWFHLLEPHSVSCDACKRFWKTCFQNKTQLCSSH